MADQKFLEAFDALKFKLHKFFFDRIKNGQGDKAEDADDLVQETAERALLSSRLPQYADKIPWLIWQVAHNVLSDHFETGKKKHPTSSIGEDEEEALTTNEDIILQLFKKERWAYLYRTIDPLTKAICQLRCRGYKYREIAKMLTLSEKTIQMRIQRLKPRKLP